MAELWADHGRSINHGIFYLTKVFILQFCAVCDEIVPKFFYKKFKVLVLFDFLLFGYNDLLLEDL